MRKCSAVFLLIFVAASFACADDQEYVELQPVPQQQQQPQYQQQRGNTQTTVAETAAPKQTAVQGQPAPQKKASANAAGNIAERIAVGFQMTSNMNVLSKDIPSLTGRYWFNDTVGTEGFFGFTSGDSEDSFIMGVKGLGIIESYKTLNVYVSATFAAGAADFKGASGSATNTMFKVAAGVGAEWFVLDNLSLSTEIGLGFFNCTNISKQFGFYADWLPQAGVRYYL
ncbi:MAG: hypothetical protein FWC57_06535 [Endomicrobia bacterium]|nr:hypothetical protein [Endomicrobiia bacterium]